MSEAFQDFGYTFSKEKVSKIEIKGIFEYFGGFFGGEIVALPDST